MKKSCKKCSANFEITDKDLEFYNKVSPIFNGKKYEIPTPKLCPDCRQQRRLSFRNERNLYKRDCDATGKQIISIYSPDKKVKVYNQDFWWSDKWDAMDYGKDFDFSKGFFGQFNELIREVPLPNILGKSNENSEYINHSAYNKNCYLCFNTGYSEDCLYLGNYCLNNKNCLDSTNISNCERCYEIIESYDCYNSSYLLNCIKTNNSKYCINCNNCDYCYSSNNLVNKKYVINNLSTGQKT